MKPSLAFASAAGAALSGPVRSVTCEAAQLAGTISGSRMSFRGEQDAQQAVVELQQQLVAEQAKRHSIETVYATLKQQLLELAQNSSIATSRKEECAVTDKTAHLLRCNSCGEAVRPPPCRRVSTQAVQAVLEAGSQSRVCSRDTQGRATWRNIEAQNVPPLTPCGDRLLVAPKGSDAAALCSGANQRSVGRSYRSARALILTTPTAERCTVDASLLQQYTELEATSSNRRRYIVQAVCKKTGEKVTIKVTNEATRRRDLDGLIEYELQKSCEHHLFPAIPTVLDAFTIGDKLYVVTKRCNGTDLETLIKTAAEPFDRKFVMRVIHQLLGALKHMHDECNVAYCNVDAENIIVDTENDNAIKLLDFGCASEISRLKNYRGSLEYMDPAAVASVAKFGPKCDIFATGLLLYYMLQLEFPRERFSGDPTKTEDVQSYIKRAVKERALSDVARQKISAGSINGHYTIRYLLEKMLTCDSTVRWSAHECLNSEYFF